MPWVSLLHSYIEIHRKCWCPRSTCHTQRYKFLHYSRVKSTLAHTSAHCKGLTCRGSAYPSSNCYTPSYTRSLWEGASRLTALTHSLTRDTLEVDLLLKSALTPTPWKLTFVSGHDRFRCYRTLLSLSSLAGQLGGDYRQLQILTVL